MQTHGAVPHDAVILEDFALELEHDHAVAAALLG